MYAHFLGAQLRPDYTDEACRIYNEVLLERHRQARGYAASMLLTDLDTGKILLVGFWNSESDVTSHRTSGGLLADIEAFRGVLAAPPLTEVYEVTSVNSLRQVPDRGCPAAAYRSAL
jgi:quinol monooxygenase YgiN